MSSENSCFVVVIFLLTLAGVFLSAAATAKQKVLYFFEIFNGPIQTEQNLHLYI